MVFQSIPHHRQAAVFSASPAERYASLIASGEFRDDPAQHTAVRALHAMHEALMQPPTGKRQPVPGPVPGLYLYGQVGRGKTRLMDLLVESLPAAICLRQHFHHFMAATHRELVTLTGTKNPLRKIADRISHQYRILCFDEFFVSDIGDAMLLGNLLRPLLENGVTLVATSNTAPENLYLNGLQRARFLPAIATIQAHTQTLWLDGAHDHREASQNARGEFVVLPQDISQHQQRHNELLHHWQMHSAHDHNAHLSVCGRTIPHQGMGERRIALLFSTLCEGPRSSADYIELATRFDVVMVLGVPCLSGEAYERIKARGTEDGSIGSGSTGERAIQLAPNDDAARRFIALIDELYDRGTCVVISSKVALNDIYTAGSLLFEFQRTRSRLVQMTGAGQAYI